MKGERIGQRLARLRRERGVTQAELAEKLHFTYQAVSNWERGVTEPDIDTILRLCEFFGVSADELLGQGPPVVRAEEMPRRERGAVTALRWVLAGLLVFVLLSQLLILSGITSFAALLMYYIADFAVAGLNIAALILFLFAKVLTPSYAARSLFFVGIAGSEVCSLALLFVENATAALVLSACALAFILLRLFSAPFVFCGGDSERKKIYRTLYFIILILQLVCAALPAFMRLTVVEVVLGVFTDLLGVFSALCLFCFSENKARGVDYRAELAKLRAVRRAKRKAGGYRRAKLRLFWAVPCAFVICAVTVAVLIRHAESVTWTGGEIPYAMLPYVVAVDFLVPMMLVLCIWGTKKGVKNRAVHWALFALWFASFALVAAYFFLDLCELYATAWEKVLYTAALFVAFVATAFLFPDRWKARWMRWSIRVGAVLAAAACSGVCLWLALSQEFFRDTAILACAYLPLLFLLSFFKAERLPNVGKTAL